MSSSVEQYYTANIESEDKRLDAGRLEYAIRLRVIRGLIRARQARNDIPLKIADIGCGPGGYGHKLYISELTQACLELAVQKFDMANLKPKAVIHRDAESIFQRPEFSENVFDIVLLLDPLYHILDSSARLLVVQNILQVLAHGSFLVVAFARRNAHPRDVACCEPDRPM
ncbi:hypothetical protein NA57DRAFT_81074 [Rhizodiscina lignyota]|uniref:Methyltransferase domain-containing protein n=1 Tax=Rhizodiscina lignyota TaxID=1504668 RepID=A0A9P4I887_9PEZI|nr:hypothetical protein NA57DRAFT_81074 [Rhizodiscina lignyota]